MELSSVFYYALIYRKIENILIDNIICNIFIAKIQDKIYYEK